MTENNESNDTSETARTTSASTWLKRGLVAAVAPVALGYGAIFFYANVLNDSPDALDGSDLSDAVAVNVDSTDDTTITTTPAARPPPRQETSMASGCPRQRRSSATGSTRCSVA